MERSFDIAVVLAALACGAVALVIGFVVGAARKDAKPIARAAQAGACALAGALLAHVFIDALLTLGDDRRSVALLLGWAFLVIPGIVDTIATFVAGGARPLTDVDVLPWIALVVGGFTGLMNGVHRIHDFRKLGVVQLVADVTWGLAGSTTAALLHLWCLPMRGWVEEPGTGAHRYAKGFHFPGKDTFAFTQGCVMSNLPDPPQDALWKHERTHTLQSRAFGPLFTLSYLAWMGVFIIPALIAAAIKKNGSLIEVWTYFNNPWEAWGYHVQHAHNVALSPATAIDFRMGQYVTRMVDNLGTSEPMVVWEDRMAWPYGTIKVLSIPYAVVCVGLAILFVASAY